MRPPTREAPRLPRESTSALRHHDLVPTLDQGRPVEVLGIVHPNPIDVLTAHRIQVIEAGEVGVRVEGRPRLCGVIEPEH